MISLSLLFAGFIQAQNLTEKSVEGNVNNHLVREYTLAVEQNKVKKTGKEVMGMTLNGIIPGPTLVFTEGDYAVIHEVTKMNEASSVHWHGFLLPNFFDGVPNLTTLPINAGKNV